MFPFELKFMTRLRISGLSKVTASKINDLFFWILIYQEILTRLDK